MFPGYSKAEELSRGNQGIVYRAIQDGTHRKVAIKLPLYAGRMSEVKRRRFFREIELIALISHPNIVQIFHSGVTSDGAPFYVMDFVDGVPLDQYVREKNLSIEHLLELMRDICLAMDHAHQQSVVHRDLKPSNILVEPDGKPTIVDFGLAKLFEADREALLAMKDDAITGKQDVIGTMRYMSPEHARGTPEKIEPRSDVYSLGVILYELLTGQLPYPEVAKTGDVLKYMDEFLRHVIETPAELPRKKWESGSGIGSRTADGSRATKCPIDLELETIVLRALAKEPERRYQSAEEMAADIGRYLAGEPIEARADSVAYKLIVRTKRQIRRHPFGIQLLLTLIVALLGSQVLAPLVYVWTPAYKAFATLVRTNLEPIKSMPFGDRFEKVRVIALKPESDLCSLAEKLETRFDVNSGNSKSKRQLFGALMQRLAISDCSVVVFDFRFSTDSVFDDELLDGVLALRSRGIPVVVMTPWALGKNAVPPISHVIASEVLYGGAAMHPGLPWIYVMAAQRGGGEVYPSLATAALAALEHTDVRGHVLYDLILRPEKQVVELGYLEQDAHRVFERRRVESTQLRVTSISEEESTQLSNTGILKGDLTADYILHMPSDDVLDKSTTEIGEFFELDESAVINSFRDKVVVVGSTREEDNDLHEYDKKLIAGCYANAAAIDSAIRRTSINLPTGVGAVVIPLFAAIAGSAIALLLRKRSIALFCVAVGSATAIGVSATSYYRIGTYFDPLVAILTLAIAFFAARTLRAVSEPV